MRDCLGVSALYARDPGDLVLGLPALSGGSPWLVIGAVTGVARWAFEGESAIVSSRTVAQGMLYFGDKEGRLYAVDGQSGQEQWRAKVGSLISTPVVANGAVFIGGEQGELQALGSSLKPARPSS